MGEINIFVILLLIILFLDLFFSESPKGANDASTFQRKVLLLFLTFQNHL